MRSEGMRELKILQDENMRLKKMVSQLIMDKAIFWDLVKKMWGGPR